MSLGDNNSEPFLSQAISSYLSTVPVADREATGRELTRFARWIGPDVPISGIAAHIVSRYQEQFPESSVDVNGRLEPVKLFLTNLKTQKLTQVNLGAHIRLQRQSARRARMSRGQSATEEIRITEQGVALLTAELEQLENVARPRATEDLSVAYGDRDFRENAPYDAAKQKLAEVQGRIDEIRHTLSSASVYAGGTSTERIDLGMRVTLHSLQDDDKVIYTIVGAGEVSAREGKISTQSPIGRALLDRHAGETVEVQTPAGVETFRIEQIERA